MDKLNVLFFIKRTKKLQNGESPIYCRLTMDGKRAEFAVNNSVDEDNWIPRAGKVKGNSTKAYRLNKSLEGITSKINEILRQLELQGVPATSQLVKDEFLGINKHQKFLVETYNMHNKRMESLLGKQYAQKTLSKHKTSLKYIQAFINKQYKVPDFELNKVNYNFLADYEHWLKTNTKCSHNSAVTYLKNLGKVIHVARNNGWIEHDPFLNFKLRYKDIDKDFLTKEQLDILINKRFEIPRLERIRDVFVFCCFTGLAFTDVKSLSLDDFATDNNGQMWIRKKRQKTKNMSEIPLIPAAERILDKYKEDPECEIKGTLLPVPANQKMNAYLKEIADLCNLKVTLTTHVARHTFATTVTLLNHVSIEAVSKMLGHSSLDMTKKYARILDKYISDEMGKINGLY